MPGLSKVMPLTMALLGSSPSWKEKQTGAQANLREEGREGGSACVRERASERVSGLEWSGAERSGVGWSGVEWSERVS